MTWSPFDVHQKVKILDILANYPLLFCSERKDNSPTSNPKSCCAPQSALILKNSLVLPPTSQTKVKETAAKMSAFWRQAGLKWVNLTSQRRLHNVGEVSMQISIYVLLRISHLMRIYLGLKEGVSDNRFSWMSFTCHLSVVKLLSGFDRSDKLGWSCQNSFSI